MDFSHHSYLKKHLGGFKDDHPLLVFFDLNPEYESFFDELLGEIDSIPNLDDRIRLMKDTSNWESITSELEFAKDIKNLNPEFVQRKKGVPSTDLKSKIFGKEIFFEVKMLAETDQASRVYKEIWKVKSDFVVEIVHELLDKKKADDLIDFVTKKIKNSQSGSFKFGNSDIKIQKYKSPSPQTMVITRLKSAILIPLEDLRKKILKDFFDKLPQFSSEEIVFWVIDTKRWKYDADFFRSAIYGTIVTDLTVGRRHYVGFEDIYQSYLKNPEFFNNTRIVPTFTYPKKDGLFFLKEAKCLNGIVLKVRKRLHFLVNPFADPQLDTRVIRKLKEFL